MTVETKTTSDAFGGSRSDHRTSILDAAFDFGLTQSEFKVYYCLMRSVDSARCSKISMDKLAQECQLRSRNTVKRALDALIQMGMVRRLEAKNCYVHQLTDPLNWVSKLATKNEGNLNTQLCCSTTENLTDEGSPHFSSPASVERNMDQKMIDQKLIDQKLIEEQEQQESSNTPLRGIADSVVVPGKEEEQKLTPSKTDPAETKLQPDNLDSKIAAARELGCNVGICWECGEMFVRIDGALKTVSEFVAMPLEVFKQSVQFCQSGLDLCRSQIEKIKERLKNQRLARLEQSATVGGSVTKQADKTSSHAVG